MAAIKPAAVNSQQDVSITQQRYESTELGRTSDEAWGVQEPAQNLGVSPSPSPLLAAAGQPPAPVPLPQSGAPGARNYLDIIRSPAPTRLSSPALPSALPPVELPSSLQSAVSCDPPFGVVAEAAAAGKPDNSNARPWIALLCTLPSLCGASHRPNRGAGAGQSIDGHCRLVRERRARSRVQSPPRKATTGCVTGVHQRLPCLRALRRRGDL